MSAFDERDFAALDADVVRVRVVLPNSFRPNVAKSVLDVELRSGDRALKRGFLLQEEARSPRTVSTGLLGRSMDATAYTCRLSDASKEEFRRLQRFATGGKTDEIRLDVHVVLSTVPREAMSTWVWADLLLNEERGFFPLIEAGTLQLTGRAR